MAVQKVAQDFRQGSAVTGLAKKLFDPGEQLKLDPGLITQILTAAGLKTPTGVKITADAAQILLAGGSIISNAEKGADIGAYMKPGGMLMKGVTDILAVSGLLPKDSPAAVGMNLAGDVALVVASGGLNVLADIAFVLDVIGAFFSAPPDRTKEYTAYAKSVADNNLSKWFVGRETKQFNQATLNFQAYQSGKLHAFELLGKIAEESPDLFQNYFPDMKYFIPPAIAKHCESFRFIKTDRQGFRSRDYDITQTSCMTYASLFQSKSLIQSGLFNKFVTEPAYPYELLSKLTRDQVKQWGFPEGAKLNGVLPHDRPVERIKVVDLAILSMFPPYFQFISDDFDIKPLLKSLYLTPADLGYTTVSDELSYGDFQVDRQADWTTYSKVDQSGNIGALLNFPKAAKIVTEWGVIPHFPEDQVGEFFRQAYPVQSLKVPLNSDFIPPTDPGRVHVKATQEPAANYGPPPVSAETLSIHSDETGYRNIRNFWSCVQMARQVSQDPYFQNFDVQARIGSFLSTADAIDEKFRALQYKSMSRKMNGLARQRIAKYYGTTPDKLRWKNTKPGELAAVLPA